MKSISRIEQSELRRKAAERFVAKKLNSENFVVDSDGVVFVNKEPIAIIYCTINLESFVLVKFASET